LYSAEGEGLRNRPLKISKADFEQNNRNGRGGGGSREPFDFGVLVLSSSTPIGTEEERGAARSVHGTVSDVQEMPEQTNQLFR